MALDATAAMKIGIYGVPVSGAIPLRLRRSGRAQSPFQSLS